MKRWTCLVLALGAIACGKKDGKTNNGSGAGTGSSTASGSAPGADPTTPPPPPTVKTGKGDCKTEYAPKPKRDPNPMCKVDGGTFEQGDAKDKPEYHRTVKLSPYFIDQFEVTNAQVAFYLNATKAEDCSAPKTGRWPCFMLGDGGENGIANGRYVFKRPDGEYAVVAGFEKLPFGHASRQGAMEYCAWAGKTLPTEAQWEFAARHDPATNKDYLYPWGDEFDGKRARCDHENCPLAPKSDKEPSSNSPVAVGSFDGTGPLGDGRSPWGVFDMAGNVEELVADCVGCFKPCDGGVCNDPPPCPGRDGRCEEIAHGGGMGGARQLQTIDTSAPGVAGFRCARLAR